MQYYYPQVSGGYRWNMLQRIFTALGIEAIGSGDIENQTYLEFERELTNAEKLELDGIMADNPTLPPNDPTVFIVRDVYDQRAAIAQALGFDYQIYYSESVFGSGNVDQLELHFPFALTETQKALVTNEYAKLISLK